MERLNEASALSMDNIALAEVGKEECLQARGGQVFERFSNITSQNARQSRLMPVHWYRTW